MKKKNLLHTGGKKGRGKEEKVRDQDDEKQMEKQKRYRKRFTKQGMRPE